MYSLRVKTWVTKNGMPWIGKGRILLLEEIAKHGSISEAAKAMKMSYRGAWQIIEEMNRCSSLPLVEKKHGGRNGGGAMLTEHGKKVIRTYKTIEKKINRYVKRISEKMEI